MFTPADGNAEVRYEQVSMVLGGDFLLTFQEGQEGDAFDAVRRRLREGRGIIRDRGADYLMYALVDTIVDNYFAVLERLGDRLAELEDRLVAEPDREALHEVYDVKRALVDLRRAVWPLRDALAVMIRDDLPLVGPTTLPYLRDVQDHTLRVIDTIETYRDLTATLIEIYASGVSSRLNEVMRVLTVIATLFIPLTFVVGVYGMNFRHMPELEWPWGYPVVLLAMAFVMGAMLVYFKRRRWF
jgi:magnesium transporter